MAKRKGQSGLSPQVCPTCGESYQPYRSTQRACSRKCLLKLPDRQAAARAYHADPANRERKNASRRIATATDPEKRAAQVRADNLKRAYGLTPEQYDAMLAAQNGVCLLCGDAPNPNGVRAASRLHVDHDHETGRVRALLCNHCNRGIGAFRDDPDLMQRASLYVWKHRQQT